MRVPEEYLRICEDCGASFFTAGEEAFYKSKNLILPKRCKKCRAARKQAWEQAQKTKVKKEQAEIFERALAAAAFRSVRLDEFPAGDPLHTLNIIGKGFERLRGVNSSY